MWKLYCWVKWTGAAIKESRTLRAWPTVARPVASQRRHLLLPMSSQTDSSTRGSFPISFLTFSAAESARGGFHIEGLPHQTYCFTVSQAHSRVCVRCGPPVSLQRAPEFQCQLFKPCPLQQALGCELPNALVLRQEDCVRTLVVY